MATVSTLISPLRRQIIHPIIKKRQGTLCVRGYIYYSIAVVVLWPKY